MQINVKVGVSHNRESFKLDLMDMGVYSTKEWDDLTDQERNDKIQECIHEQSNQPYRIVEEWN